MYVDVSAVFPTRGRENYGGEALFKKVWINMGGGFSYFAGEEDVQEADLNQNDEACNEHGRSTYTDREPERRSGRGQSTYRMDSSSEDDSGKDDEVRGERKMEVQRNMSHMPGKNTGRPAFKKGREKADRRFSQEHLQHRGKRKDDYQAE